MNITVLGTGSYGIALALKFHNVKGNNVKLWTKFKDEKESILKNRINERVLPGVKIPLDIEVTDDLEKAVSSAKLIVIALPAMFVGDVVKLLKEYYKRDMYVLIAAKGIDRESASFVHDVFRKYIKTYKYGVISGPSFAVDMVVDCPIGLTVASEHRKTRKLVIDSLKQDNLDLEESSDVIGVEICSSIKNIIAIASGMLNGLGYPESTDAMFLTKSINSIKDMIKKFGGDSKTILTYAGFGDLLLTATSKKSRNYTYGQMLGAKKSRKEVDDYVCKTTIEGLETLKSIYAMLRRKKIKVEIIELIHDIVMDELDIEELPKFILK